MSTQKLIRELRRSLKTLGAEMTTMRIHNGHVQFTVIYQDQERRLTMGGSPRDEDRTLVAVLAETRRFIRQINEVQTQ